MHLGFFGTCFGYGQKDVAMKDVAMGMVRRSPVSLLVVRVVPAAPHAAPDVVFDDEVGFLVSYLSPRLVGSVGRNREWQNWEWQNWAGDRGRRV